MENKKKIMKYLFYILISTLLINITAKSQEIHILNKKSKYEPKDTITIKVMNQSSKNLFYGISSEIELNGSWKEFEGDVTNMPSKTEIYRKIKKGKSAIYHITFPSYINRVLKNNNNLINIRFRLNYGISIKNLTKSFSDPILIVKK